MRTLATSYPIALFLFGFGWSVERLQICQQSICIVRDPDEPLRMLFLLDFGTTALARTIDHLVVGKDGLTVRTSIDKVRTLVDQSRLVELRKDPLRPLVVRWR